MRFFGFTNGLLITIGQHSIHIKDLTDSKASVNRTGKTDNKKEKVTADLQLHGDQGFQYTSYAYFNMTTSSQHNTVNVNTQKSI